MYDYNRVKTATQRVYRNARDAADIAREVVAGGKSDGWAAWDAKDQAVAKEIEERLGVFNIGYVDDMLGRWAFQRGGSKFFQ